MITCWPSPNCHFPCLLLSQVNRQKCSDVFHKGALKSNFQFCQKCSGVFVPCNFSAPGFLHVSSTMVPESSKKQAADSAGSKVVGREQVLRHLVRAAVMYHSFKLTGRRAKSCELMETDTFEEISTQSTMEESRNSP